MLIINLIGPPCGGKTQFASKYVLEHPEFRFCSIDAYRVEHKDEEKAWESFVADVIKSKNVIIESCGLDWKLGKVFLNPGIIDKKVLTIAFVGEFNDIYERLAERQHKRPINYEYNLSDEFAAISYVLEHLGESISPIDFCINTSIKSIDEQYKILSEVIALARINNL